MGLEQPLTTRGQMTKFFWRYVKDKGLQVRASGGRPATGNPATCYWDPMAGADPAAAACPCRGPSASTWLLTRRPAPQAAPACCSDNLYRSLLLRAAHTACPASCSCLLLSTTRGPLLCRTPTTRRPYCATVYWRA